MAGCHVVGYGFDDASVEAEGSLDEVFSITGGAAAGDADLRARLFAPFAEQAQSLLHSRYRVAVVAVVVGVQQLVPAVEDDNLRCGRAGVDAQRHFFNAGSEAAFPDGALRDAFFPPAVVVVIAEDGFQAFGRLVGDGQMPVDGVAQAGKADRLAVLLRQGRAPGGYQMAVFRQHDLVG